jgi:hypothetical protein
MVLTFQSALSTVQNYHVEKGEISGAYLRTPRRSELSCTFIPASHPVVMCLLSGDEVVTLVGSV